MLHCLSHICLSPVLYYVILVFFFFQAEDGIRDYKVTGVQTCALPISWVESSTSFLRSAGSFLWKSGFIATPNEDTYEYISVEYFSVPPILKAMPAPP